MPWPGGHGRVRKRPAVVVGTADAGAARWPPRSSGGRPLRRPMIVALGPIGRCGIASAGRACVPPGPTKPCCAGPRHGKRGPDPGRGGEGSGSGPIWELLSTMSAQVSVNVLSGAAVQGRLPPVSGSRGATAGGACACRRRFAGVRSPPRAHRSGGDGRSRSRRPRRSGAIPASPRRGRGRRAP